MGEPIEVLDHGFVRLVDAMGSDLSVVNAARISHGVRKEKFDSNDEKLIQYLVANNHSSPLRHCYVTLHMKAPIFLFRQFMKHSIGVTWNEASARYRELKPEFYIPEQFRQQAVINKQGSFGSVDAQSEAKTLYEQSCLVAYESYQRLIELGVAREQARGVLPVSVYSEAYCTASLQAIAHFIKLRADSHAQWEAQQYAVTVRQIMEQLYPVSMKYLLESPNA